MSITQEQVRSWRLRAHHLNAPLPPDRLTDAAGACGVQNSPPGSWETAIWNRLEGCTLSGLQAALYREKSLLQAWSYRGAPVVFPTAEWDVFLTPLQARPGEEPWVYTQGITGALDHLGMEFDRLLPLVQQAARTLETETVVSKEELDRRLAARVEPMLPPDKLPLWRGPSMYGSPDRQTVGGAAVSFLLRPCSFAGQVVFGRREGAQPTFTAPARWLDGGLPPAGDRPDYRLVRRFLRCYGPATHSQLAVWLGCSTPQARRLWAAVEPELEPVTVDGKRRFIHREDLPGLAAPADCGSRLLLLGPHDPYLDTRDRAPITADPARQKLLWRTVGNPGVLLLGGQAAGSWRAKTTRDRLEIAITPFQPLPPAREREARRLAEEYAAFRRCSLTKLTVTPA